ncbi:amidase family protein [bacterium]|nr:amidase family protein [bacterium]
MNDPHHIFLRTFPAEKSDRSGPNSSLSELLFVVKENISVCHSPTSWGFSPPYLPVAPSDAAVVTRCEKLGATLLGCTNCEPGAIGARGKNPYYGDITHEEIPGELTPPVLGSSGGVAVAVRSQLAHFGIGTDLAGSIRLPALSAQLWSIKFAPSELSHRGVLRHHAALDTLGIITPTRTLLLQAARALGDVPPTPTTSPTPLLLFLKEGEKRNELLRELSEEEEFFSHWPNHSKLRLLHQKIVAHQVAERFPSPLQRAPKEFLALQHFGKQLKEKLPELEAERRRLQEGIAKRYPEPMLFITPISLPLRSAADLPEEFLLTANILEWPAAIAPISSSLALHIMCNSSFESLLQFLENENFPIREGAPLESRERFP